jgi:hypothetical protein
MSDAYSPEAIKKRFDAIVKEHAKVLKENPDHHKPLFGQVGVYAVPEPAGVGSQSSIFNSAHILSVSAAIDRMGGEPTNAV